MTIYNFSAGPAVLPKEVLKKAQAEFLDYAQSGMSVMELSHRSKEFDDIIKEAESFVGEDKAVRINLTINSPTSAIKVNINKLPIRAELIAEIENQRLRGEVKDIQDEDNSFY